MLIAIVVMGAIMLIKMLLLIALKTKSKEIVAKLIQEFDVCERELYWTVIGFLLLMYSISNVLYFHIFSS